MIFLVLVIMSVVAVTVLVRLETTASSAASERHLNPCSSSCSCSWSLLLSSSCSWSLLPSCSYSWSLLPSSSYSSASVSSSMMLWQYLSIAMALIVNTKCQKLHSLTGTNNPTFKTLNGSCLHKNRVCFEKLFCTWLMYAIVKY